MRLPALLTVMVLISGCEYGDQHGSAENSDMFLGLKEKPVEMYAFRAGEVDFTGYFISEFPASSAPYFTAPSPALFDGPKPMSYEKGHTIVKWRSTPVASPHEFLLKRTRDAMKSNGVPPDRIDEFTRQTDGKGRFYAAKYEDSGNGRFDNITFYLIEPAARRLYHFTDTSSF